MKDEKYEIKPLVWKQDEGNAGNILSAISAFNVYHVEPSYNGDTVDWSKCSASFTPRHEIDDYEIHLAHGVGFEYAKKICNDEHESDINRIITNFVRIV